MKQLIFLTVFICFISCNKTKSTQKETQQNSELIQQIDKDTIAKQANQKKYPVEYFRIMPDSIVKKGVDEILYTSNISLIINQKQENSEEEGLYLEVKKKNKIIFESAGQYDSWRFRLCFLKNNSNNNILVVGEIGDEESWGAYIYIYNDTMFKEIGFMDVTSINEHKVSTDITPFIEIKEIEQDNFIFTFKDNITIYDNEVEKYFSSKEIYIQIVNLKKS